MSHVERKRRKERWIAEMRIMRERGAKVREVATVYGFTHQYISRLLKHGY